MNKPTLRHHLTMRVISPAPRSVWHHLLTQDESALVSQSPEWIDCLCSAEGYADSSRLYEMSDGRTLLLPLVRRALLPGIASFAGPPSGWGIGGLLADGPITQAHMALVWQDLAENCGLRLILRPNPLAAELWSASRPKAAIELKRHAHILDLSGGFDTVWRERFKSDTRRYVRNAEKASVEVISDSTGMLVPQFYALFEQSLVRWAQHQNEPRPLALWRGHRRDPQAKFQQIAEQMGEACRIWMALVEGKPAAAILVLLGRNAHYTRGVMNEELAGPTRANFLLHKHAIEAACERGCGVYHMGETGESPSLAQFKSRFGAVGHTYAEYRLEHVPFTRIDKLVRGSVKRVLRFRDV